MGFGPVRWNPEIMSPAYEHPSLNLLVSDEQRDRAVDWLQRAYADGRLTEVELDQRLDQVFAARTRRDLNLAFYGLVQTPPVSQALGLHQAYQPLVASQGRTDVGRGIAALSYFSAIFLWIFGPLVGYLAAPRGSYAKNQAASAFDFTLVSTGGMIAGGILGSIWEPLTIIAAISGLAWFVLCIVGGAKAVAGERWENPVLKILPWRILSKPEPPAIDR